MKSQALCFHYLGFLLLLLSLHAMAAVQVVTDYLPSGTDGSRYFAQLEAAGAPPYGWSLSPHSEPLPNGLHLTSNGILCGTNTTPGLFNITVRVEDAASSDANRTLAISVLPRERSTPDQWDHRFFANGMSSVNGVVLDLLVDGTNLFAGGRFITAGGFSFTTANLAVWNGRVWSSLGGGLAELDTSFNAVYAIARGGTNLYATYNHGFVSGGTAHVAKWDGAEWSLIGTMNGDSRGATVFDLDFHDGSLYASGSFRSVNGLSASNIARWDGTRWFVVGGGLNSNVQALAVAGDHLYAGGLFSNAGGSGANYIARWDGVTWSAVGSGVNGTVWALAGSQSDLYVGGSFTVAGAEPATNIARWNGSAWSSLAHGAGDAIGRVSTLVVNGSDVYAGGVFDSAGGVAATNFAKWDGARWSGFGSGLGHFVDAIAVSGSNVYAGGSFTNAGNKRVNNIARHGVSGWVPLGDGVGQQSGSTEFVRAVAASVGDVYAGGSFRWAGGILTSNVARWDGNCWSPLGTGLGGSVEALVVDGSILYAGGTFARAGDRLAANIASWDGSRWFPLGSGVNGVVRALATDGTNLYAGGRFTRAGAIQNANQIAKWDGADWSGLGGGLSSVGTPAVNAIAISGTNVYIGGSFSAVGGMSGINNVARWDGSRWLPLGDGVSGSVYAIAVSGTNLYVGGSFYTAGGQFGADRIARWDGQKWFAFPYHAGYPAFTAVYSIVPRGPELFLGGTISNALAIHAHGIVRWSGTDWSNMVGGLSGTVYGMALRGSELYVGGDFQRAGAVPAQHFAKWTFPLTPPVLSASTATNGHFSVTLRGTKWETYTIEGSTNTADWFPILTTNAPADTFPISDTPATNQTYIYRAFAVP